MSLLRPSLSSKKRASAAARKQKERARKRKDGFCQIDVWITANTKDILATFAPTVGSTTKELAALVLKHATPRFLREIGRCLDELRPVIQRIRVFESYGVKPRPVPCPSIRIGTAETGVVLDPFELYKLHQQALPLIAQMERYGIGPKEVSKLIPARKDRKTTAHPTTKRTFHQAAFPNV